MNNDSNQVNDEINACKETVRLRTFEPVIEKIREKLKEFAKQKGYVIIVDKFSLIPVEDGADDITLELIRFCNDYFDKEKIK